ncbi:MAG: SsrA-binding protein SmpB [Candidatus Vogelbacteria bacterium]|nr:SsrA-binding protein SmpB [Candidatus Vogelbacteria bacterium]
MPTFADNRQAGFRYELLDKFEAGLELIGLEVKSIKAGRINLASAYVLVRDGEAYLVNADIAPYQPVNTPLDYDSRHHRRLLLTKREIAKLAVASNEKRLTIIPVRVYSKARRIKIEIALARGKKKYDKREATKKREAERQIDRTLKTRG